MNALQLFKAAGIEDYLAPTLTGAGIGALGFGAGNLIGQRDKKMSGSERLKSSLMAALKGGALGGAAGAGAQGAKDIYGQLTDHSEELKKLFTSGKAQDTRPHETGHPIEHTVGQGVGVSPLITGAGGAAAGGYAVNRANTAGSQIASRAMADSMPEGKDPGHGIKEQLEMLKKTTGKMDVEGTGKIEGLLNRGAHSRVNSSGSQWEAIKNLISRQQAEVFPEAIGVAQQGPSVPQKAEGAIDRGFGKIEKLLGMGGDKGIMDTANKLTPDRVPTRFSKLLESAGTHAYEIPEKAKMLQDQLSHPLKHKLLQYGKGMGVGAVAGAGIQGGANALFKGWMNGRYPDEQLKVWNQLAGK